MENGENKRLLKPLMSEVPLVTVSHIVCGLIRQIISESEDVEKELKTVGYDFGLRLLEIYNFDREVDLRSLLYKITFTLLSSLYEGDRKLEKAKDESDVYLITESSGIFGRFISTPKEWIDFSADSIVCGVIEAAIVASGFRAKVVACPQPLDDYPDRVVYQIRIKS